VRRRVTIWAVVLVAVGAIWIGQGLGIIRGASFMVDDVRWAVIGGAAMIVGLGILLRGRIRRA